MRVIAKRGEFRIHGSKPGKGQASPQLLVRAGEGFSPAAAEFLELQFLEPRRDYRHAVDSTLAPGPSIVDDLAARGYDLASFRFSVFMKGFAPAQPRMQLLRQRPGVLHARWSWVEYDHAPDLVCAWALPCSRRDSNLILGMFSIPSRSASGIRERRRPEGNTLKILEAMGVEVPSLRFLVKHKEAAQENGQQP